MDWRDEVWDDEFQPAAIFNYSNTEESTPVPVKLLKWEFRIDVYCHC